MGWVPRMSTILFLDGYKMDRKLSHNERNPSINRYPYFFTQNGWTGLYDFTLADDQIEICIITMTVSIISFTSTVWCIRNSVLYRVRSLINSPHDMSVWQTDPGLQSRHRLLATNVMVTLMFESRVRWSYIEFLLQGLIITCSDGVLGSESELLNNARNLMGGQRSWRWKIGKPFWSPGHERFLNGFAAGREWLCPIWLVTCKMHGHNIKFTHLVQA